MNPIAPLAGLRVLDLGRGGAAAYCTRLLSLLGAELQILNPADSTAQLGRLAGENDVVVSDLQPAEARALGLDPSGLAPAQGAVLMSVTPFGLEGPWADRPAVGSILEEMAPEVVDALAGAHAAVAALAALRWARHHRRGLGVEVATLEVVASCLGDSLPRAICPRQPASNGTGSGGLTQPLVLPCADGYVGVAIPTPVDRRHLASLTGIEGVGEEGADLGKLLEPWLRGLTRAEIFHTAQLWRLPVVPVLQPSEVREDEQLAARGFWTRDAREPVAAGSPFRFTLAREISRCEPHPGPLPLSDIGVLDLGMVWAGPYCGRLLAGLGARVVKVEGPTRWDGTRPPEGQDCCSGAFGDLNRGKASLVLDLSTSAGHDLFLRLALRMDMVVENFSPRVMPNFGLDYAALATANPGLLMLSMPAFGSSGPWASYVAYGNGLELATGLACSDTNGRPASAPVAYLDYLAGCHGAAGLLAALMARDRSGRGAHLEVAQREVACQLLGGEPGRPSHRSAIRVAPSALAEDAHLRVRGLFAGPLPGKRSCHHYARLPWKVHGLPVRRERSAPSFGADSRRLLRRLLGMDTESIDSLVLAGVVGARPARQRGKRNEF